MRQLLVATILALAASAAVVAGPHDPYVPEAPRGIFLDPAMIPEDNPITPAKVELGRRLFFDKRLSRDSTVSCASCHDPRMAWTDGRATGVGIDDQVGTRNTPTVLNRVLEPVQFWDGRAATMEEQALGPIGNPIEMGFTVEEAVDRLAEDDEYVAEFQAIFGAPPDADGLAKALATFQRTLMTGDAPHDRPGGGGMSDLAKHGRRIFEHRAGCVQCHLGPNLSDEGFHNIGVGMDAEEPDLGRFAVTGVDEDRGAFKTPTLRNIALTGPYFHDGSAESLEEVIELYDQGGQANPWLSPKMRPLNLHRHQKEALLAYLREGLTGSIPGALAEPR
jgi:cytochrome c peroxidase